MKQFTVIIFLVTSLFSTAQDSLITWNREVAIVSATVRRVSTGWQFVTPNHDPLGFAGTITATSSTLTIPINFAAIGLNHAEWTPSGQVVGADETYAQQAHTFGASVSSTQMVIRGSNGIIPSSQIGFNGTTWVGTAGYTASWNSALKCLELVRNLTDNSNWKQGIQAGGVPSITVNPSTTTLSQLFYAVSVHENSNTRIRIAFFNGNTRVATPDTNMKVSIRDDARRPQAFDFTSNVTALEPNANIWIVGTFVKINTASFATEPNLIAYPNPSNGHFRLSSQSDSPITVYDIKGTQIGTYNDMELQLPQGIYIIEQDGLKTKIFIH
jgi:hypothetical protein